MKQPSASDEHDSASTIGRVALRPRGSPPVPTNSGIGDGRRGSRTGTSTPPGKPSERPGGNDRRGDPPAVSPAPRERPGLSHPGRLASGTDPGSRRLDRG